jgi:hypothetical protein
VTLESISQADWWDLVPAVVGGVLGALAGGIPAYLIAVRQSNETVARERQQRVRTEQAQAFRLFATISLIFNSFFTTRLMIEEMLRRPASEGDPAPNQRRVQALVGIGSEKTADFGLDDLSLLVAAKQTDYLTSLELASRRHQAIIAALGDYRTYKDSFTKLLLEATDHEIASDGSVSSRIRKELHPKILLLEAQLESIITPVIAMLRENTPMLIDIAERFGPIMKAYFGAGHTMPAFDVSEVKARFS